MYTCTVRVRVENPEGLCTFTLYLLNSFKLFFLTCILLLTKNSFCFKNKQSLTHIPCRTGVGWVPRGSCCLDVPVLRHGP